MNKWAKGKGKALEDAIRGETDKAVAAGSIKDPNADRKFEMKITSGSLKLEADGGVSLTGTGEGTSGSSHGAGAPAVH